MTRLNWDFAPAAEFAARADAWDALNESGPRSPLLEARYILTAIESLGVGSERIAVGTLEDSGELAVMAVLARAGSLRWQTFQPSQCPLAPLVIGKPVPVSEVAESLAGALGIGAQMLSLTQLDPDLYDRPVDKGGLSTLAHIDTARITVAGSFDDYWAGRGKNLRQNLKKQRNRLEKAGVSLRLAMLEDPSAMAAGVSAYGALESASWKGAAGSAVAADNRQGAFYTALLEAYAASGDAMVAQYFFDDALVASDLCVSGFGTYVILKTTYDEQQGRFSPALLMRQSLFPAFFDEKRYQRIEFYGRVMEWHRRWSDEIRELYHVNFIKNPLVKAARDIVRARAGG